MIPETGPAIYDLCVELFPICRSITGQGVRDTLAVLKRHLPALEIHNVPTGQRCFDWSIPREWSIRDAYILDPHGNKIVDFNTNNLHVVGYSVPVNRKVPLNELQNNLHSLPDQPSAIPYITSYYAERWGFCITQKQRDGLEDGDYTVVIDSALFDGSLTYGELIVPGETTREIFLSTYVCHPSMANNELSGPAVTAFLAKWIMSRPERRYTYRIIFIPETIGSIAYLSQNLKVLKQNVVAGFNITCVGDEGAYSYLPSRKGGTLADAVALHVLKHQCSEFKKYKYLDRGSDERQYCSPGVDLPVASIMRSKYGTYPEYHTSLDDLNLISAAGLQGSFAALCRCIETLEGNVTPHNRVFCEPQLGKRGLYPTLSTRDTGAIVGRMMDLIAYSDGEHSLLEIAEIIDAPLWELLPTLNELLAHGILDLQASSGTL